MASSSYLNILFIFLLSCTTLSARTISNSINRKGFHSRTFPSWFFSFTFLLASFHMVTPVGVNFNMKLAVGTPPMELIAVLDTGSDLIWTQCQPCESCFQQPTPILDIDKSSTNQSLGCNSNFCNDLSEDRRSCDASSKCNYYYNYRDRSFTRGVIASETLTFDSSSGDKVKIPTIGFVCRHNNQGTFSGIAGIMGVGRGPLTLVSQLGSSVGNKFSYCLVPLHNQSSSSLLKFGDDISVGNKKLNIPTGSLTPTTKSGGFIIDSGTALTMLASDVYGVLDSALREMITLPYAKGPSPFTLCYSLDQSFDFRRMPNLTFHFDGGADWLLPQINSFVTLAENVQTILCSAFVPSNLGISIFGNVSQRDVYVEYDLGNNVMSFAPTVCTSN